MILKGEFHSYRVWLDGIELLPKKSLEVVNHSPTGFSWGYRGSGCSQLALGILLEVTDKNTALCLYRKFKDDIIANLPQEDFEGFIDINDWLQRNI